MPIGEPDDFDDLAGFVGAPQSTKEGETTAEEQRAEAEKKKARPTVLPDEPFRLEKLRSMDADVTLTAEQIDAPKLPLENMKTHLVLEDGVMELKPLDFGTAGGTIAAMQIRARAMVFMGISLVRGWCCSTPEQPTCRGAAPGGTCSGAIGSAEGGS